MKSHLVEKAKKTAAKSQCRFRISALGFNKKGELISVSHNKSRYCKFGGGIHAEEDLIKNAGPSLSHIVICRINKKGSLLPIHPCERCQKIAKKHKIKIYSLHEEI